MFSLAKLKFYITSIQNSNMMNVLRFEPCLGCIDFVGHFLCSVLLAITVLIIFLSNIGRFILYLSTILTCIFLRQVKLMDAPKICYDL